MFKLVIGDKGKAWKIELDNEHLVGKSIGDKVHGKEIKSELDGYEFEITGGSDIAGFPLSKDVPGLALKALLLTKGWGMRDNYQGIRRSKTVRGKVIAQSTSQINLKVIKAGHKHLAEIFPEQNQPKPKAEAKPAAAAPAA
jgi:small subunit ribosomal protein S6e